MLIFIVYFIYIASHFLSQPLNTTQGNVKDNVVTAKTLAWVNASPDEQQINPTSDDTVIQKMRRRFERTTDAANLKTEDCRLKARRRLDAWRPKTEQRLNADETDDQLI